MMKHVKSQYKLKQSGVWVATLCGWAFDYDAHSDKPMAWDYKLSFWNI